MAIRVPAHNDVILSNFIILRAGGLPRVTLSRRAGGRLHCNAHDLLRGAEVQHDTGGYTLSARSGRGVALVRSPRTPFFPSPSFPCRNVLPANVSSSIGPGLTTHILKPYLARKAREFPHTRHA